MQDIKCVVVGDGAVGKSCLLVRYTTDTFPEDYVPTVLDNDCKQVTYKGEPVNLSLWDTRASEDYGRLRPLSYPQTDVFIICVSVLRRKYNPQFGHYYYCPVKYAFEWWYHEVKTHCPNVPIILAVTKCDQRNDKHGDTIEQISGEEFRGLAQKMGAVAVVECSALTGKNVSKLFQIAIAAVIDGSNIPKKKKSNKFFNNLKTKFQSFNIAPPSSSSSPSSATSKIVMTEKTFTESTGNSFSRRGHAAVFHDGLMYVFCGFRDDTEKGIVQQDHHESWDGNTAWKWETFQRSESLEPRTFPCATIVNFKNTNNNNTNNNNNNNNNNNHNNNNAARFVPKALIFGGKSNGYRCDLHAFDFVTKSSSPVEVTGKIPSARYGMTAVTHQNNMFIFGGYDTDGSLCDDCYKFDTDSKEWTRVALQGDVPTPRLFHTAVCLDNVMVVYGGKGDKNIILDDMYLINLNDGQSQKLVIKNSPGPRRNHACVAIDKQNMLLIGGTVKPDTLSNDVFLFNIGEKSWKKVNLEGTFAKREMHTAVFAVYSAWVFGGIGENRESLLCSKISLDSFALRFYEALPRYLSLLILSFLDQTALARFSQVCKVTHELAEENVLWIELCKRKTPTYKYHTENPPKEHLKSFASIWMNPFTVAPTPHNPEWRCT